MRELERLSHTSSSRASANGLKPRSLPSIAIVGRGRAGSALSRALRGRGLDVSEPLGRGADPHEYDAVLLCVPDSEIASAAARVSAGPLVGHCSGASGLELLAPHEAFSLHPLMTIADDDEAARFAGAGAAIAGSTPARARGRTRARIGARDAPVRARRARSRRLPRGRVDRVQLPGDTRSRRGAAGRRGRRGPRGARRTGARDGRQLGKARAP